MSDISDNEFQETRHKGGSYRVHKSMVESSLADMDRPNMSNSLKNI